MSNTYTLPDQPVFSIMNAVPLYGSPMTFSTLNLSSLGRYECFYCGSGLPRDQKQCPGCGARDWQRIRR